MEVTDHIVGCEYCIDALIDLIPILLADSYSNECIEDDENS